MRSMEKDMAIISCPQCAKSISDKHKQCPHCECQVTDLSNEQFTIGANGEMVQKSKAQLQKEFASENEIARFSENDL